MRNIAIVGVGELGGALQKRFSQSGFDVKTFDSNPLLSSTSKNIADAVKNVEAVFICAPTKFNREIASEITKNCGGGTFIVSFSKGFDSQEKTAAEILGEVCDNIFNWAVVGGPMLAEDLIQEESLRKVTAVIGSPSKDVARALGEAFDRCGIKNEKNNQPNLISFLGILKNIYAVALGIAGAKNATQTKKEFLLKTALLEMQMFCREAGFDENLVMSPAGQGDLVATGQSDGSRNRQMGIELATQGKIKTCGEALYGTAIFKKRFPNISDKMPFLKKICDGLEGKISADEVIALT